MAKKKKVVVTTSKSKQLNPTTSKVSGSTSTSRKVETNSTMLFKKKNYMWSLAGIGLIALGLLLMSGGKMPDSNTWDPDLIYSFRRITLAPIIILAGLAFQIVAIFKK
jgi:sulfite exporter TauE/SafE